MARRTQHPSTQAVRKWRHIVEEWRGSGLSAREFCEKRGLKSHKTLHVWSSKLNKIDANPATNGEFVSPTFVPIEVIHDDEEKVDADMRPETIDVYLACGDMICVPRGCDMQQLSQIVTILRKEWQ
jgi:hypothetical protein